MKTFLNLKKTISFIIFFPFIFIFISKPISYLENNQTNLYSFKQYDSDTIFNYSIEEISTGFNHSGAIVNDGINSSLYIWGNNSEGQLGLGNDVVSTNIPQKVIFPIDANVEQISMSEDYSLAVLNDGTNDYLYGWGRNKEGQLGTGDYISYSTPEQIEVLPFGSIEQISTGKAHSAAVIKKEQDNSLYIWGNNNYGQLGLGNVANYNTPQEMKKTTNDNWLNPSLDKGLPPGKIKQISLGYKYTGAIVHEEKDNRDHLYVWGDNRYNQLGIGLLRWGVDQQGPQNEYFMVPQEVSALPAGNIKQISMGNHHSGAIVINQFGNHLYTWGENGGGQLGIGKWSEVDALIPMEVTDLPDGNFEQISMGYNHSAIVVNDSTGDHLYMWGNNDKGQLGLGEDYISNAYLSPQEVKTLPEGDIKQVSLSYDFYNEDTASKSVPYSAAIVNDGITESLYMWGNNEYDQLGLGDDFDDKQYETPQKVWSTPYVKDIVITPEINLKSNFSSATINYSFESNLQVEEVEITLKDSLTSEIIGTEYSKPLQEQNNSNLYYNSSTFYGLEKNKSYTYEIKICYSNYLEEEMPLNSSFTSSFENALNSWYFIHWYYFVCLIIISLVFYTLLIYWVIKEKKIVKYGDR